MNIESYIGKPFAWYGQGPDAYDCYGLVWSVLRDLGIHAPRYEYQASDYAGISTLIGALSTGGQWQLVDAPQPGDVLLMGHTPAVAHHIGIVTPEGVLHTTLKTGAILQSQAQLRRGLFRNQRAYRWAP